MTHFGEDPSIRAISLLRTAARELLPIVVDMGPDQAKYSSFVSSVRDDGRGVAVLEPIAANALPNVAAPFSLVPAGGSADWSISATSVWREGDRRACVDLGCARVLARDARDSTVVVQPTDLLVLVVPGGLLDASYVFPVQRIGTQVCEIRCSVPLSIGADLECVELVGDRRLLRRAAAQVLDVVPWYQPDGSRSFSCRLSLSDESIAADGAHDLVSDASEVRRLLQLASSVRASGWFEAPGHGRGTLQWAELGKDYAVLALDAGAKAVLGGAARSVRVGMEVFGNTYELDVRLLECGQGLLRTSLPLILRRRRRHRRDQRVAVDASLDIQLGFRNPVSGAVQSQRVSELSFFSVRFEFEVQAAVLWRGLPLEQGQLRWGKTLIHLGDLVVEQTSYDPSCGKARCLASIPHSSIADDPAMISLMAMLAHPQVRAYDGGDFSALHRTYLKAGLFGSHMHRNLDPIVEQTKRVWRKAHIDAADVVRTFLHGPLDAPDAAMTVMRAWEHGWVSQHFVDTSPELGSGAGKLQNACLDYLVPRPDGRYMLFFVKTDNRVMNSYLRRFFASTGTPDAVTRVVVELWVRKEATGVPPPLEAFCELRSCVPGDELIVARAAQRALGTHAAAALSFRPGELLLPDTRIRFGKAGLERDRQGDLVLRDGEPIYAIVEERSTPGMNLTWMLNACWIIPIHPELDPDGKALEHALRSTVERPAQTATGERFLNLPAGIDPGCLQRWGFAKEAAVFLYVLTRAGVHRLFSYATSRYGEVDALTARRERRRSNAEADP